MKRTFKLAAALVVLAGVTSMQGLVSAQSVTMNLGVDQETVLAGAGGTAYLKVGLVGRGGNTDRPPLNLSIVLDRSGSMDGEKLERAREAAEYAVGMLMDDDIVSVVIYDDEAEVLVPATRARDKNRIIREIRKIRSGGSTALFGGVSVGAGEIRRFKEAGMVNRIILLSDGLANVGPSSPQELGRLGAALRKEGISVSTIGLGLGYNEDLMVRLALSSDGNHAFVEEARDLVRIFDAEFKDALAIVASEVDITITCAPGVVPLRIMNRDGDIIGQDIKLKMNQVLGSQEKYLLVELSLPAGKAGSKISVATARTSYLDLQSGERKSVQGSVGVSFSADTKAAQASVRKDVKEVVVLQLATEANEQAVILMDAGKDEEAKKILSDTAVTLDRAAKEYASPALGAYASQNAEAAASIENEDDWGAQRKTMREEQSLNKTQRSY